MSFLLKHSETTAAKDKKAPAAKDKKAPAAPLAVVTYPTINDVALETIGPENIRILLDRHTGDDRVTTWELVDDAHGVKVWRGTVDQCEWCAFRAACRINARQSVVEQVLLDPHRTLELDEMMEGIVTLRDAGERNRLALRQITSKGQFPIHGREFLVVTAASTLEDGRAVIATRSVDVADVPPLEGYVRANNYISGYIIEEKKDTDENVVYCVVTLVAHADLAGLIPSGIINVLGTSSTVKVLKNLEKIVTTK